MERGNILQVDFCFAARRDEVVGFKGPEQSDFGRAHWCGGYGA